MNETEVIDTYVGFFEELAEIVGRERLDHASNVEPGQSLERDVIRAVASMAQTLNLLAAMLPSEYLETIARQERNQGANRDFAVTSALAPIVSVWRADVWDRRRQ